MGTNALQDKIDRLVAKRERLEGCFDLLAWRAARDGAFDAAEVRQLREVLDELVAHCVDVDRFLTSSSRPLAFGRGPSPTITKPGPRPALPR